MMSDPNLDPATIVEKVLNDFTDNLDGQAKSELNGWIVYLCSRVLTYVTFDISQIVHYLDVF